MNPQSQKLVATGPKYTNNERDKGNKQRKRKANSGDMSVRAFSHGRGVQKAAASLIKAPDMLLTGKTRRIDKKNLTIAAAKQTQLICANHALKYITPLTATTDNAQFLAMEQAGLFEADVVGLDLEWETIQYPTKRKPARIYNASVLVLSCAKGTVLYHLWQFQGSYVRVF